MLQLLKVQYFQSDLNNLHAQRRDINVSWSIINEKIRASTNRLLTEVTFKQYNKATKLGLSIYTIKGISAVSKSNKLHKLVIELSQLREDIIQLNKKHDSIVELIELIASKENIYNIA